jgi:hypothetical protein
MSGDSRISRELELRKQIVSYIRSVFLQGIPDEIKTPTRGHMIDCGMIARPLVLSPNSILPPQLSNCTFIF